MENIMVPIHDDPGQEARLQATLDVVRAIGGHLYCLDIVLNRPVVDNGFTGIGQNMMLANEMSREDDNMAVIDRRLKTEDLPFTWADAVGDFAHSIARHSSLIDMIVVIGCSLGCLCDLAVASARTGGLSHQPICH